MTVTLSNMPATNEAPYGPVVEAAVQQAIDDLVTLINSQAALGTGLLHADQNLADVIDPVSSLQNIGGVTPAAVDLAISIALGGIDGAAFALLAGRATGQTLIGGTAASETLTLQSTAHATRGDILLTDRSLAGSLADVSLAAGSAFGAADQVISGSIHTTATPTEVRQGTALLIDADYELDYSAGAFLGPASATDRSYLLAGVGPFPRGTVNIEGTIQFSQNAGLLAGKVHFLNQTTTKNKPGVSNHIDGIQGFQNNNEYVADTDSVSIGYAGGWQPSVPSLGHLGFSAQPVFGAINGGTLTNGIACSYYSGPIHLAGSVNVIDWGFFVDDAEDAYGFAVTGIASTASTDTFAKTAHGLTASHAIRFFNSAELGTVTTYYVLASGLTANAFKISATDGGSPVNLTLNETGLAARSSIFTHGALQYRVGLQINPLVSATNNIAINYGNPNPAVRPYYRLTQDAVFGTTMNVTDGTDAHGLVQTSVSAYSAVLAIKAAPDDSQPVASMFLAGGAGALALGAGGSTAADVILTRTGGATATLTATSLLIRDGTDAHGGLSLVVSGFANALGVKADPDDVQSVASLINVAGVGSLQLGPGGATGADVILTRTGTAAATLTATQWLMRDGTDAHGGLSLAVSGFATALGIKADPDDVQSVASLIYSSGVASLEFGPGGATANDVKLSRTGTAAATAVGAWTFASPVINTGISGSAIDADATMAANSNTRIPTQAAVKAALAFYQPLEQLHLVADADYTILASDHTVLYSSITAPRVATLPTAAAAGAGKRIIVGDASGSVTGSFPIIITRAGSDTIDGAASETIQNANGQRVFYSDGISKWSFDAGVVRLSATQTLTSKTLTDAKIGAAINAQTGTAYTLVLTDASKLVTRSNASASTLTIPANGSVAYPTGTKIDFYNLGAGTVTLGITTDTLTGATSYAQFTGGYIFKTAATTWVAFKTA